MQGIIERIKKGDEQHFKELYDIYYPVLCVFASKYIRDEEQCKDVAQEALLLYWRKSEDFDHYYKVKSYLYTVVKNRCLNILKREKIDQSYRKEMEMNSESFFEEGVIEQETFLLVREAVNTLPERMREVIRYAMEGLKNQEIAEKMSIAEGTVHALKKTAYRKLRERLKEHFYLVSFFLPDFF